MSEMRRCEAGHVYDPTFYHRCPSCGIPGLAVGASSEGTAVYGSGQAAAPANPRGGGATVAEDEPTAPPDIETPAAAKPPAAPQAPRERPAFRADADPNATRIVGPPPPAKPKPPQERPAAPPPQRIPAGGGATQLIEDPLMGGFADPRRKAREEKSAPDEAATEKAGSAKAAADTSASEKAASQRAAAEKPPAQKAAADEASPGTAAGGQEAATDIPATESPTADLSAPAPPPHAPPPHAHQPAESGTIAFWGDLPGSKPAPGAASTAAARPVVGWLVAIDGPEKGKDYRLLPEGNPIGRAETNQVVIEDPAISQQEPHAILYYDPRSAEPTYYLQPGPRQMVYHNGKPIFAATTLEAHDVLEMGGTKLLFVPLCTDRFRWSADSTAAGDDA